MKFQDMKYTRPDVVKEAEKIALMQKKVMKVQSGKEFIALFDEFNHIRDELQTDNTLAMVRHTIDTRDEFYDKENDYFDESTPVFESKSLDFYREMLASPYKQALEEKYGKVLIEKIENAVKSSDERLVPLQQEENALGSAYQKLYASARIMFQGEELTVAQMTPFKQDTDRAVRKAAYEAEGGFFDSKREELDEIYSKMLKNRTEQAKMLGYSVYTPLGDIRMERHGYTREEIGTCRKAVQEGIVPIAVKLKTMQAERIGAPDFKFYDELVEFKDGNAKPTGTPEEILAAGQKMYRELSPETAEFIDFMMERDLFDVLAKQGKAPGGYCTNLPRYKAPFIFSNFNGTAGDVDVLTHEAGHAFADYVGARMAVPPQLKSPGLESCEIHSMSMEFLTGKWHNLFFGDKTDRYSFAHAADTIYFMPYGCQVDEFQETVYNNPNMTPNERNKLWLELEHKYRPWIDFADLPFYSRGAGWQRQTHIYTAPFYYIDYVLAQAVALQFFLADAKDPADAWKRYLALVNKAGTDTYKGLVKAAGMGTPFEQGVMQQVGPAVFDWIKNLKV